MNYWSGLDSGGMHEKGSKITLPKFIKLLWTPETVGHHG